MSIVGAFGTMGPGAAFGVINVDAGGDLAGALAGDSCAEVVVIQKQVKRSRKAAKRRVF